MSAMKSPIVDNISEEYYQISPQILSSFPKYRQPLDLYRFQEDIARLMPYSKKGQRLTNQQVEEIHALCEEGDLFVSRTDHPVYSKHIVKQLDLVLVDKNLKQAEIADITIRALQMRLEEFFDQSVQPVFDKLYQDIMVWTEYLSQDPYRIRAFCRRLLSSHSLVNHSLNCGILGVWMFIKIKQGKPKRRDLDRTAMAMLLHDMGMSKIPQFILTKSTPLSVDDRSKVNTHVLVGAKLAAKLGLTFDEIKACALEHHERLDGSGYPRKVGSRDMSKMGQMMAVIDSFCAMTTERPYAKAIAPVDAAAKLEADKKHYNSRFAGLLHNAYLSDEFLIGKDKENTLKQEADEPPAE